MKKFIIHNAFSIVLAFAFTLAFTACSDPGDEIIEGNYPRVFSPLDFEANNVKENTATLKWKQPEGAILYRVLLYADDSLEFKGEPIEIYETADISYTLSGLVYDTQYSALLEAISGDATKDDSKYSACTFRTSAQQILANPKEEDVLDRSVTLSWNEGENNVSKLVLMPGNITHEITAEEKEASKAIVEGLNPETAYDAYLYFSQNGVDKQRGHRAFTTIADLSGATIVDPAIDDLKTLLMEAEDGQVFALKAGAYYIGLTEEGTTGAVVINKNVTLKGIYPTNAPIIYGRLQLEEGAGVTVNNIIFDGSLNGTTDQTFVYKTADVVYGPLTITNSEIRNYGKGVYYVNVACTVTSMTFENCLIYNIACDGGDMFDCRKGYIPTLKIAKSTIWNTGTPANRDCIRYDNNASSFPGVADPVVILENNTFYNFGKSHGILYVRFAGNKSQIKNNLMVDIQNYWSNQSATNMPEFVANVYCNSAAMLSVPSTSSEGNPVGVWDEGGKVVSDPKFKDPASGDFTIQNEDVKKLGCGDPRWLK